MKGCIVPGGVGVGVFSVACIGNFTDVILLGCHGGLLFCCFALFGTLCVFFEMVDISFSLWLLINQKKS